MTDRFVRTLGADDWHILRQARLDALRSDPAAFGGDLALELARGPEDWQALTMSEVWAVAVEDAQVVGLVSLRAAPDADDADCWIRSWWVAPQRRGLGVSSDLLAWVDAQCVEHLWPRQGLGVWCDNERGRALFTRLGFTQTGEEQRSEAWAGRCYVRMVRRVTPSTGSPDTAR